MQDNNSSNLNRIIKKANNAIRDCKIADISGSSKWDDSIHKRCNNKMLALHEELEELKKLNLDPDRLQQVDSLLTELTKYSLRFNKL